MSWTRSLLVLLLGLWMGVTLAVWIAATLNFRTVDRIIDPSFRPEFAERSAQRGPGALRTDLRFLASELNRSIFFRWGLAQLVLAAVVTMLLRGVPGRPRGSLILAGILLVVCALIALGLTPWIRSVGRSLDFVPRPLPPERAGDGRLFGILHAAYLILDFAKAALVVALWVSLTRHLARLLPGSG